MDIAMHEYDITSTQREKAYEVACGRNRTNRRYDRPDAKFSNYDSIETDWQGAIAEVILKETFPFLENSQPFVVNSLNTKNTDFKFRDMGIEVKCCRIPHIHPDFRFFVNVQKFIKVKSLIKYVICCGINDAPKTATKFYVFGWVEGKDVDKYPVNTKCVSPAFAIPIRDMKDIYMLFCKPEFDGEKK